MSDISNTQIHLTDLQDRIHAYIDMHVTHDEGAEVNGVEFSAIRNRDHAITGYRMQAGKDVACIYWEMNSAEALQLAGVMIGITNTK